MTHIHLTGLDALPAKYIHVQYLCIQMENVANSKAFTATLTTAHDTKHKLTLFSSFPLFLYYL